MAKRTEKDFFSLSAEEQAKEIERTTKKLLDRLPSLKKHLKMYGEVSDELYNLEPDEVQTISSTYARAVRGGEISTPSSKRAYRKFINDMRRYTRPSIMDIANQTANARMESWLETIRDKGSTAEIEYAEELVNKMTDADKRGFTRSKYFLDTENWNSQDNFVRKAGDDEYSIMTLKLELYMQSKGHNGRNIYNQYIATDGNTTKVRHSTRKGQHRRK